jgi:hypothetical protein
MNKICKVCRLEQPNHKMSCKDSNKEYVIPTAGEIALKNDYDHEEAMKEFTNLHLDNAIKEWSEYLAWCELEYTTPLTYVDWLKDYKLKNKLN